MLLKIEGEIYYPLQFFSYLCGMKLEKFKVCTSCLSVGISYVDCRCTYMNNYETVELEFEVCECCGNLVTDYPADTKFNEKQGY